MNATHPRTAVLLTACWLTLATSTLRAAPFTYQGQLTFDGVPVNESAAEFHFYLYDTPDSGIPLDNVVIYPVEVLNGLFTYLRAELTTTGLGLTGGGFNPWPGLILAAIVAGATFGTLFYLIRRTNRLTLASADAG